MSFSSPNAKLLRMRKRIPPPLEWILSSLKHRKPGKRRFTLDFRSVSTHMRMSMSWSIFLISVDPLLEASSVPIKDL